MFKKLKLAYVAVFYKLCMFVTSWVQKTMLHLINFQGLDPSRDVVAEQRKQFYELLSKEFSENPKREIAKIPVSVASSKHDVKHRAFKIQHPWAYGAVPDYTNVECRWHEAPAPAPLQVVKAPVEPTEVAVDVVVAPEVTPVAEVVEEVAEEDILEVITIVEEVTKPVKIRKPRRVKTPLKKVVKKPLKKVVKKSKKK